MPKDTCQYHNCATERKVHEEFETHTFVEYDEHT